MHELLGNKGPACGWVRTHSVPLILAVLLLVSSAGWTLTALKRNAHSATCPQQDLHAVLAGHVHVLEAQNARPVAPEPHVKRPRVVLPEGMEIVTLPFNFSRGSRFVLPGMRVDVLATGRYEGQLRAFPMLIDLEVLSVDTLASQLRMRPEWDDVLLAVTKEEARLVRLAKSRGCQLEILLHHQYSHYCDVDTRMSERVLNSLSPVEIREALPTAPAPRHKARQ